MQKQPITKQVVLEGISPLMFDRYAGDNKTQLLPEQKMYLDDSNGLILPSLNIVSFLSANNTRSAVKCFYDPRKYKNVAAALLSFVSISPLEIPITRKGKQIQWAGWGKNGINLLRHTARLAGGIPNPKERPVIDTPWGIEFTCTIYPNDEVGETEVHNLFERGGFTIGLGTFRGVFGKFRIAEWK